MSFEIRVHPEYLFSVHGNLNFDSVPSVEGRCYKIIDQVQSATFDFADTICDDDGALALLIAITRYARHKNKTIRFINVANKLLDMAKVSGLDVILPFVAT